jgi:hypothetical protein
VAGKGAIRRLVRPSQVVSSLCDNDLQSDIICNYVACLCVCVCWTYLRGQWIASSYNKQVIADSNLSNNRKNVAVASVTAREYRKANVRPPRDPWHRKITASQSDPAQALWLRIFNDVTSKQQWKIATVNYDLYKFAPLIDLRWLLLEIQIYFAKLNNSRDVYLNQTWKFSQGWRCGWSSEFWRHAVL